ncbi:hypothetical protein C2S52_012753 [Perilla frutescens var. hirtella]|nr:hypothetical protein C2S52_012753 [Perilla frutescens var. hirtella]
MCHLQALVESIRAMRARHHLVNSIRIRNAQETPFNQNYFVHWGSDHVSVLDQGREVQIKLDPSSGGGIKSKQAYNSGVFKLKIKTPQHANGIVTTFYVRISPENRPEGAHSELDFELLGQNGPPYKLNTNVFAEDGGNREQQFKLWFDPTSAFHEYKMIWNQYQIVFFMDGIPIRVFKNYIKIGARYPKPQMYAHATLWNSTQWLGQVNWSQGPFYANFRDFTIDGCSSPNSNSAECDSPKYYWNSPEFHQLDPKQEKEYEDAKRQNVIFDYCKSPSANNFPECKME